MNDRFMVVKYMRGIDLLRADCQCSLALWVPLGAIFGQNNPFDVPVIQRLNLAQLPSLIIGSNLKKKIHG